MTRNVTTSKKNYSKKNIIQKEFSSFDKREIVDKLITARVGLLLKHPFFGNMATRLSLVDASDWCMTLATDGRHFYYNNSFVDQLNPKEAEFCFAHEVIHNIFDHLGRKGDRDHDLFNIAADYAANQILVDEKIGTPPRFIKIFQNNKYRGWHFEKIYDDLKNKCNSGKKGGNQDPSSDGELLDDHLDFFDDQDGDNGGNDSNDKNKRPRYTPEEWKKIRDEIKEAIVSAAQSVSSGNLPAGISRLISNLTDPKMDWRELLRLYIQSIFKNNFSYTRPNRKSQHSGAILPGLINQDTIDICVSFDMSGSITNEMAKEMISEVAGIMQEFQDFKIRLWTFDTSVYNYAEFTSDNVDEISEYTPKGGGGTLFECNWEFMKDNEIEPKRFIMFTDGYPNAGWGDAEYCDTLFIIHGNTSIVSPFGQTAYYE